MKIAKYIADLLFEYECIVIPGLGGFISKEIPAKILPIQNHFNPPSKEIVFNAHLTTNDGLLVNHLARKENLSYVEARDAVERFVKKCLIELKNGKQIRFHKVGLLFMDKKEKTIQFEPDKTQNYLADSFGLKNFVSPQIKRTIHRPTTSRINKTYSQESNTSRTRTTAKKTVDRSPKETLKREYRTNQNRPKYIHINVSFILFVLAIAALFYFRPGLVKSYYNNYSSLLPIYHSSAGEYLTSNLDKSKLLSVLTVVDKLNLPDAKAKNDSTKATKKKSIKPQIKNQPLKKTNNIEEDSTKMNSPEGDIEKQKDIPKQQPDIAQVKQTLPDYKHFIIAGVFRDKINAEKMTLQLKAKGYNAMIVDQNSRGLYRVCFDAFTDINQANQQMAVIRKEEESNAWLLSN